MLKNFEISGFGACVGTSLRAESPLVALIGKNGTGKTTLLQSIAWTAANAIGHTYLANPYPAMGLDTQAVTARLGLELDGRVFTYSAREDFEQVDSDSPEEESSIPRMVRVESLEDSASGDYVFSRRGETVAFEDREIGIGARTSTIGALTSLLPADDPQNDLLSRIREGFAGIRYYPLREPDSVPAFVTTTRYANWVMGELDEVNPSDALLMRLVQLWEAGKDELDELSSLLGPNGVGLVDEFHMGETDHPARDGESVYYPMFRPGSELGGWGKWILWPNLSDGTRRVVEMLTCLIFDKRSVMLLEQPEDSIHPSLLKKVIDVFRSYTDRTQVIFSTHSPDVLNMVTPDEVRLAQARSGHCTIRSLTAEERGFARAFVASSGPLSEFLETVED